MNTRQQRRAQMRKEEKLKEGRSKRRLYTEEELENIVVKKVLAISEDLLDGHIQLVELACQDVKGIGKSRQKELVSKIKEIHGREMSQFFEGLKVR